MVSRQILYLDEASGAASSHVLDEPTCPAIAACDGEHGLVLLHRGLRQVLAKPQHLSDLPGRSLERSFDLGLGQRLQDAIVVCEPVFELDWAIGVSNPVSCWARVRQASRWRVSISTA